MITPQLIATVLYGLLVIGGGLLGYLKSNSTISLISGGISGLLLLILGIAIYLGNQWAAIVAAIIISLLIIIFIVRWLKTKKFMPAIPTIFFGIVSLIIILS